ncbi:hypothetical protein AKJ47_02175 [candidate division MSBL1 archaeon SCGC-AAA261G05]|uniref:Transposase IS4-like domain-containing protein n=2 Tax=candidate division MSBL1 TaxID=215777 RepID=A0A133VAI4_9EURY|nr:hypothetical protein AKJ47_02175 [candidate division MSBL1 archaeon SCGC-AAA261G05]KXB03649.1 hypothetical protein AKJ48_03715 [candidate division MSBL1 archaeon SCGC-AAA261O19]
MTRNWREYNGKLVKRGEFYLSPDFLDSWDEELEEMNRGKIGRPYEFPESFVQFAALWYEFFHLPYRQLEGVLRKLGSLFPELKASDYSTLWHRFKDLKIEVPKSNVIIVAVDSTGIKVTNRGEWMRKTHRGERGGWIKVHVAVDVESKEILSIEVTDEKTGDSEVFEDLVEDLDPKDCLGDGGYDSEKVFKILEKKGVGSPGIKIRKNARTGLSPRGQAAKEFQELGHEEWKKKHEYGKRWAVEGFFSAVKRCFGETVRAASPAGMVREVKRKFGLYNLVTKI